MVGYRYKGDFIKNLCRRDPLGKEEINEKTADWHLFQLCRDLSLTKAIYEQKINYRRNLSILPESLRSCEDLRDPINETNAFIFALRSFLDYIQSKEKPFIVEIENTKTLISYDDQRIREVDGNKKKENKKKELEDERTNKIKDLVYTQKRFVDFVKNVIHISISTDDNNIDIRSPDSEFIKYMQNVCRGSGYSLNVQSGV